MTGVWVRWRMGARWSRAHFAAGTDRRDVAVGSFPLTCGAWAPDGWDADDVVVVDSLDAACKNCIREDERNRR